MNIDDLTIGEAKKLSSLFSGNVSTCNSGLNNMIGEKCIIRTYSAGVWFGEIEQKSGKEVIVKNARRLWYWHTKKGISLSAISQGDIDLNKCNIPAAIDSVWLEAIELIPCTKDAIKTLEGAKAHEAS